MVDGSLSGQAEAAGELIWHNGAVKTYRDVGCRQRIVARVPWSLKHKPHRRNLYLYSTQANLPILNFNYQEIRIHPLLATGSVETTNLRILLGFRNGRSRSFSCGIPLYLHSTRCSITE